MCIVNQLIYWIFRITILIFPILCFYVFYCEIALENEKTDTVELKFFNIKLYKLLF